MKKIIGIGNALTDILLPIENDDFLEKHHFLKGSMQLVDFNVAKSLEQEMANIPKTCVSGGSCANTITGLAQLGVDVAFVGKISSDEIGKNFESDMKQNGINPIMLKGNGISGFCTAFISPDGERTMATYLGASAEISAQDIKPELFANYDLLHIEGYLLQNHNLIKTAIELAKQNNLEVSLDLASYNVVEENIDFLKDIINKYVDIVFANEEESFAYTKKQPHESLEEIAKQCKIAIVKVGAKGSMVQMGTEKIVVDVYPAQRVDTTGAGDLYAAGFLAGYAQGKTLEKSAKMGSFVSSKIVEIIGPKFSEKQWNNIRKEVENL